MPENIDEANSVVTEEDTRAMVRLLGEIVGVSGGLSEKRRLLMDGICKLVDADRWLWAMMGRTEEGRMVTFSLKQHGGFSDQQMVDYLKAQEHPDMARLNAPFLSEYFEKEAHLTRTDWQLISAEDYMKTEVAALFEKADLGPLILSFYPMKNGHTSGIAIYREPGKPPFSPRGSLTYCFPKLVGFILIISRKNMLMKCINFHRE